MDREPGDLRVINHLRMVLEKLHLSVRYSLRLPRCQSLLRATSAAAASLPVLAAGVAFRLSQAFDLPLQREGRSIILWRLFCLRGWCRWFWLAIHSRGGGASGGALTVSVGCSAGGSLGNSA